MVLTTACSNYGILYDDLHNTASDSVSEVGAAATYRNASYTAGESIISRLKYLLGQANFTENVSVRNTTRYDIDMPAIAAKAQCDTSPLSHSDYPFICIDDPTQAPTPSKRVSCADHLRDGSTTSGMYSIHPVGYSGSPFDVYCDMTTAGGGWTIVSSVSGADGEPSFVEKVARVESNPLNFEAYTLSAEQKDAISAGGNESLFVRPDGGAYLKVNFPMFGKSSKLLQDNKWDQYSVTVTSSDGSADSSAYMGWANYAISGGGSFGLKRGSFDRYNTHTYHMLARGGCNNSYIYDFSNGVKDSDAGYDVSRALGNWQATQMCRRGEGGMLQMYAAIRR